MKKGKKITVDLVTGTVTLTEPGSDTEQERADMIYLTAQPQWKSMRSWFLRQAVTFFSAAGMADREEAYIQARFGKFITDTISAMDTFAPVEKEQPRPQDAFDDDGNLHDMIDPSSPSNLPLAPLDE